MNRKFVHMKLIFVSSPLFVADLTVSEPLRFTCITIVGLVQNQIKAWYRKTIFGPFGIVQHFIRALLTCHAHKIIIINIKNCVYKYTLLLNIWTFSLGLTHCSWSLSCNILLWSYYDFCIAKPALNHKILTVI